jgi:hypothetical protein
MGAETSLANRCDEATRDIEATRRRIEAKAGSLEDRITPKALLRPVQRRLEGTLGAGGEKILEAWRDHPLPLALTGVGLGWLVLCEMRGERRAAGPAAEDLTSKAEDLASKAKETAADVVGKARETAADVVGKARETAAAVPRKVRETARKTSDWFSATIEENPMMLAVGALAAGLLAAFVLPMTAKEEEALGDLGEKAAEAVLDKGKEALETPAQPSPVAGENAPAAGPPPGL